MKTLDEIFKDSPELLETKEVEELVDHFKKHYKILANKHMNYRKNICDLCMSSDLFIKGGISCADAIDKIIDL